MRNLENLTPEQARELHHIMHHGATEEERQAARQKLIECNIDLVTYVLTRLMRLLPNHPKYEDAHQEGVIGLIEAVDHWDPEKGQFSTIAVWWIRQAVQRYLDKDQPGGIGVPFQVGRSMNMGECERVPVVSLEEYYTCYDGDNTGHIERIPNMADESAKREQFWSLLGRRLNSVERAFVEIMAQHDFITAQREMELSMQEAISLWENIVQKLRDLEDELREALRGEI